MKAIETVYNGHKFRSRTEARWAVFFDALNVVYRYEPEGFDLDGTWYLPDFWLPQQNCWYEVKGEEPTNQEIEKADLLTIYTQKPVYIAYGDVWIPEERTKSTMKCGDFFIAGNCDGTEYAYRRCLQKKVIDERYEMGDMISEDELSERRDTQTDCYLNRMVTIPPHIMALYYRLNKCNTSLKVVKGVLHINAPLKLISKDILSRLERYESELIELLSYQEKWLWEFDDTFAHDGCQWWCNCPLCGKYGMSSHGWSWRLPCKCLENEFWKNEYKACPKGTLYPPAKYQHPKFNTYKIAPIVKAYTAARQERF